MRFPSTDQGSPRVLRDLPQSAEPRSLGREVQPVTPSVEPRAKTLEPIRTTRVSVDPGPMVVPAVPSPVSHRDAGFEKGLEEGRRQGFEEGREKGFEAGRKAGLEEGIAQGRELGRELGLGEVKKSAERDQEAIRSRLQRLDQMLEGLPEQLESHRESRLRSAEDDLLAICYTAICKVIGDKLVQRDGVLHAVRHAVEQCCGSGSHSMLSGVMALHVNPKDLIILQSDPEFAEWFRQNGATSVPWVTDEQVDPGGCLVRSSQGSLDARMETQLLALREVLLRERASLSTTPAAHS